MGHLKILLPHLIPLTALCGSFAAEKQGVDRQSFSL